MDLILPNAMFWIQLIIRSNRHLKVKITFKSTVACFLFRTTSLNHWVAVFKISIISENLSLNVLFANVERLTYFWIILWWRFTGKTLSVAFLSHRKLLPLETPIRTRGWTLRSFRSIWESMKKNSSWPSRVWTEITTVRVWRTIHTGNSFEKWNVNFAH